MDLQEAIHRNTSNIATSSFPPDYSESSEECPSYSCSIAHSSTLFMKRELSTPSTLSTCRKWRAVHAEVYGTMLQVRVLHGCSNASRHQQIISAIQGSPPSFARSPTCKYTLQGGQAGIAFEYTKRKFVFRVRAEAEQFLLLTDTLPSMLEWIEVLNAAINISLPIESREMLVQRTVPRPPNTKSFVLNYSIKHKLLKLWAKRTPSTISASQIPGDRKEELRSVQFTAEIQERVSSELSVRIDTPISSR